MAVLSRSWRVAIDIHLPIGIGGPPGWDPSQGPPNPAIPLSRFAGRQQTNIGGLTLLLDRIPEVSPLQFGQQWERVRLTVMAFEPTPIAAIEAVRGPVERVLDDLAFRMQSAVLVGQAEALDVTPPVEAGQQREMTIVAPSFPRWKFSGSRAVIQETELQPRVRLEYVDVPDRPRRALDWYVKGLAASVDADRFLFFWVALEILERARDGRIQVPYKAPCGHEIPTCPECGAPTDKIVAGANIQAFLRDLDVSADDARALWSMRQMVHGDRELTRADTSDLPRLTQLLKAAVTYALKGHLGLGIDEMPIVPSDSPWMGNEVFIGGTRAVADSDLASQ
jgi:hypothetical protein